MEYQSNFIKGTEHCCSGVLFCKFVKIPAFSNISFDIAFELLSERSFITIFTSLFSITMMERQRHCSYCSFSFLIGAAAWISYHFYKKNKMDSDDFLIS